MGVWNHILMGLRGARIAYEKAVRALVFGMTFVAGSGVVFMMAVTCLDVVMRKFKHPLPGALDLVEVAAAVTVACSLPYTTAVKGHVAIEYFFHKLSRRGRIVVDTLTRTIAIGLFVCLCRESIRYGVSLYRSGQVTLTLQMPVFWVPFVIAFSSGVVVLVILHNLLHPGKEMIRP